MEESNADRLCRVFGNQFGTPLTVDRENGLHFVDDAGRVERSTRSGRANWLRRNAPRFGFEPDPKNPATWREVQEQPELVDEPRTPIPDEEQADAVYNESEDGAWRVDLN